jgi:hypothetical protein
MFSVIALTGGLSTPGESATKETAAEQTAAKPTADKQVDQRALEVDSPPDNNPGEAETRYTAVSEPGATDTQKAKKVQRAGPERAAEIVKKGAGSGSSTGAGDANASGSGSGGGAGSGGMGHGSPGAGGEFQLPGGGGFSVGGGSNQSPSGTRPAPAAGAPANPPQTGPVPVLPLAGPPPTPTPSAPASSPNLPGPAPALTPVQPLAGPLPSSAPLQPQAGSPPAVPIPTPDQIIPAALDPTAGGPTDNGDGILRPGHSPGTAHVPALTGLVGIEIEISGPANGQYDVVIVDGAASFPEDFKIAFILLGDYIPASGSDFEFLFADSLQGEQNILYSFLKPASTVLPNGFGYQVYVDDDADLHVRFFDANSLPPDYLHDLYTGQVVVVPEPSTTALGLLGLALLGWRMHRPAALPKD